jgi:hypothetical protein
MVRRGFVLDLARRDPHDMDSVADNVGGSFLASGASGASGIGVGSYRIAFQIQSALARTYMAAPIIKMMAAIFIV